MGSAKTLTSISFYHNNGGSLNPVSLKIYLAHYSSSYVETTSPLTSATCVYTGSSLTIGGSSAGWETYQFDDVFSYNGSNNLMVIVCRGVSNDKWSSTNFGYQYTTGYNNYVYLYRSSDTDSYADITNSSNYSRSTSRPNVKFTYTLPGPSNSTCATATSLPCGTNNLAGTTVGTPGIVHNISGASISNYGVWYTFIGDGNETTITVTDESYDVALEIAYSDSPCSGIVHVTEEDDPETYTFTPINGKYYYAYVAHYSSSGTSTGTFNISRTCTINYTITTSVWPSGGGSVSGTTTVPSGGSTTLTATAASGYQFVNWTGSDGNVVSSSPSLSLTNVTSNASYQANFTSTTPISITASTPWTETFESYGYAERLPGTWATPTRFGVNPQVVQWNPHAGNRALEMREANGNSCMAVLPLFDKPLNTLTLSFYRKRGNSSSGYTVEVGYVTNPSDASTFVVLETVSTPSGTSHSQYTSNFSASAPSNSNYRLAIRFAQSGEDSWYFDDFNVSYTPPPVTPEITSIVPSCTSATVNWTGNSSTYTVWYGQLGTAQNILSQDFEGGSMPSGWSNVSGGTNSWTVNTGYYDNNGNHTGSAHGGSYNAVNSAPSDDGTGECYLVSPSMDLSTYANAKLTCWYINPSWQGDIDDFGIYYRTSSSGEWQTLFETTAAHGSWTQTEELDLPSASYVQIGFKYTDDYGYGIGVDDVLVTAQPKTGTSVPNLTGSSYTITGLTENTTYYVTVKGNNSDPSDLESFTTDTPYTISVSANNASYGTVSGGGSYCDGTSCTVTATPNNSCYSFVNWTVNGSQVSTNASYTFTVTGNRDLVANFEPQVDVNDITVTGTTTISCGNSTVLTANGLSGVIYNWYSDAACTQLVATGPTLTTPILSNTTTYYVKAVEENIVEGTPASFSYRGYEETYSVPSGYGFLKLEVWGAQGGNAGSRSGGKGGYSVGTLSSPSGTLYVCVGGQGTSDSNAGNSVLLPGGWNGGGAGRGWGSSSHNGAGGGGATHIANAAPSSGSDYQLRYYDSNQSDVLVVAGGGGGASDNGSGGAGGGTEGIQGSGTGGCAPGTQSSGSAWGYATDCTYTGGECGGGGGGYYGGYSATSENYAGGGGSGYLNPFITRAQTIAGNLSMPDPNGGTMTGREGDGYARITPYNIVLGCESAAKAVTVTVNPLSANDITVSGTTTITSGSSTTLTATGLSGVIYKWYSDAACTQLVATGPTLNTPTLTNTTTYYVKAMSEGIDLDGLEIPFTFEGAERPYTIPAGISQIKLEVWGAEGGGQRSSGNTYAGFGGKGGYSVGTMPVLGGETLYVYVGGIGGYSSSGLAYGGFNGGGTTYASSNSEPAGGGGGGTDIRLNGNTLYHRIIVAGGGGGGGEDSSDQGGYGGGTSGGGGNSSSYPGTQNSCSGGAVFGSGASSPRDGGAGGGGWYGGGCNGGSQTIPSSNSTDDCSGGSGGSGYVWTSASAQYAPSGYSVPAFYYLSDAQTIGGNSSMPNPSGGTMTGREGDGYARITLYSPGCESDARAVTVTVQCTLNVSTSPSGSGFTASGGGTFNAGTSRTVTASTTNSNYVFAFWKNGSTVVSTSSSYTFTLSSNTSLVAYFAPLHIANATQWNEFSTVVNDGFNYSGRTAYLDADITVTTTAPVGTSSTPFQGTFEGNGHVVNYTHSANVTDKGLFGYVSGSGNIQNLIVNATLSGTSTSVGAVVGTFASSGIISNVEGAGTISSSSTNAGGIVGRMTNGTLHSSFAAATLSGSATNMGGLVGSNSGNLYNCYSNCTFSGSATYKGGLAGVNNSGKYIENCYAAGIVSGVYAFAASNSGTIRYCYADAQGSGLASGTGPVGSGLFGAVQSDIKHLDYMFRDNIIPANTNTYVGGSGVTGYVSNHIPVWNGLLSALNQWVRANPRSISGLTSWYRPMTTNINGDLPVLAFPKDNALATTNVKYLQYNPSLDRLLSDHASNTAYIFHYGTATGVTQTPGANVHVFVQEDAVLLQAASPDPGAFNNTTVGVTFDNSDHGTHAQDFWGNTLSYDWHLLSTPLNSPLTGATHGSYNSSGDPNSAVDITGIGGYFPNNLITQGNPAIGGSILWDFYSYYEPQYHWINLKRNKNNHYHYDGGAPIVYNEADQDAGNGTAYYIPGKGYMMAISQNTFMNATGTLNRGNVSITLTNQEPADIQYAKGWNLVGNPYQAYLNLDLIGRSPIYTYDADQGLYLPFAATASENPAIVSQYIHPHQAFFVHTDTNGETMTFTQSMATTTSNGASYYREDAINYPLVNLFAENSLGQRDLTVVEFHRPEIGGALKYVSMNTAPFSLAAHHNGTSYGILFSTDDLERIPVHFKTEEDDDITLTWSYYNGIFSQLYLVDNLLGVTYDMLTHDSYFFHARITDYASRFYITYECTGVDEYDDSGGSGGGHFAYISNDNIIIKVEAQNGATLQLVDVLGRVLYSTVCPEGMHTVSTSGLAKGVYIIRLATNNSVRTQKVIVK